MKKIVLLLSLTVYTQIPVKSETVIKSKMTESQEYLRNINVHLVVNKWKPLRKDGSRPPGMVNHDNPLPEFPGTYAEADQILRDYSVHYPSISVPLYRGMELLLGRMPGAPRYDKTLESIFISSGLSGNARDGMGINTVKALAMRNILKNYNIFVFDLTNLKGTILLTALKGFFGLSTNYKGIAMVMGDFIHSAAEKKLMFLDRLHLFGFCYSAQLVGFVGRYLYQIRKEKVKSIMALDPHSLGLSRLRHTFVSAEDAEVVHAYHTNSLLFGTLRRKATADFVFNNGTWQPGCGLFPKCSHTRAVIVTWYVILYPDLFVARQCESLFAFKFNRCKTKNTVKLTFPPTEGNGKYYINTGPAIPFGIKEKGANL